MGVTSYLTLDGEILSETRNGVESDYIPDPLGSTSALTNSSQTITDTFSWWPYGEERSHIGPSTTPFGYHGTLGYYCNRPSYDIYVRKRPLDPQTTQWRTIDANWPTESAYAYAACRPVTLVDPKGDIGILPIGPVLRCLDLAQTALKGLLHSCDIQYRDCLWNHDITFEEYCKAQHKDCISSANKLYWIIFAKCVTGKPIDKPKPPKVRHRFPRGAGPTSACDLSGGDL